MDSRLQSSLFSLLALCACVQPRAQESAATARAAIEQAVTGHLKAQREASGVIGVSAACVLPDQSIVAVAIGVDGADVPLTITSRLMSGSIGKTYCAAVVLQLVAAGDLALDGKVGDVLGGHEWYARIPNAGSITLRQLLSHTSGIREHVWNPKFHEALTADADQAMTPAECLSFCLDDAPLFAAGERFAYADTNYLLAGLCVEKVTGKPFATVLNERILTPLQLSDTKWNDSRRMPALACGLASGAAFTKGPTVVDGKYFVNPVFEYCGGGIRSTPSDLAKWMRALFAGDVVPEGLRVEHVRGVAAPRSVSGSYGLGCFVGPSQHGAALGHSGIMPGFLSYALYYPELKVAVAVQFPSDDGRKVGNMRRLCDELAGLAAGIPAGSKAGGR